MNKKIKRASEHIKKALMERNSDRVQFMFVSAINEISTEISKTVCPLNDFNLPFIAAVLLLYHNALVDNMDPTQKRVYADTIDLLKQNVTTMKIELPTKGGK